MNQVLFRTYSTLYILVNSVIVIIRLMLSVSICPTVITLGGFHCTLNKVASPYKKKTVHEVYLLAFACYYRVFTFYSFILQ
jgi:hypothetical protein